MDSWTPNHDRDTYRCAACGCESFVPGVETCSCAASAVGASHQESPPPGPAALASTLSAVVEVITPPPTALEARSLVAQIAQQQLRLAKRMAKLGTEIANQRGRAACRTLAALESRHLSETVWCLAEARKSAESLHAMAVAAEEVELVERKERLADRLEALHQAGRSTNRVGVH